MGIRQSRSRGGFASNTSISSSVEIKAGLCNADPITKQGKRIQMAQMLCIPLIPVVALIILTVTGLDDSMADVSKYKDNKENVNDAHHLTEFVHALQVERADVLEYTVEPDDISLDDLQKAINETNRVLQWYAEHGVRKIGTENGTEIDLDTFEEDIELIRNSVWARNISHLDAIEFYSDANNKLLSIMSRMIQRVNRGSVWKKVLAFKLLLRASENYGIELLLGMQHFFYGNLTQDEFFLFIHHDALGKEHVKTSIKFFPPLRDMFQDAFATEEAVTSSIANMKELIFAKADVVLTADGVHTWTANATRYLDLLFGIEIQLKDIIMSSLEDAIADSRQTFAGALSVLILVLVITPVIFYLIQRVTASIQDYAQGLSDKTKELRREKKRSDRLLYQMLPKSVALQLKLSRRVAAESYTAVTIFFSDIVGFTSISARSSPMEVVTFLNKLYYFFDTTIDRYDVYKVETIGDAYMVASGLPQRNGKRHAGEIGSLSLDLLEGIKIFDIPHMPDVRLKLRIGLHTGPVVAGVVGSKMPRYCLFGDTVNIASKMESLGVPLRIQISSQCKKALEECGGYFIDRRGLIDIKGKGDTETFFLKGKVGGKMASTASSLSAALQANSAIPVGGELPILNGLQTLQDLDKGTE